MIPSEAQDRRSPWRHPPTTVPHARARAATATKRLVASAPDVQPDASVLVMVLVVVNVVVVLMRVRTGLI